MPAAERYDNINRDLREAAEIEYRARLAWHDKAWRYYEGSHAKPLKVKVERDGHKVDNNVIVNLVSPHVDCTVSFVAPEFPTLTLDAENAESADEKLLNGLWRANRKNVWLGNALMYGILEGHVFVRILEPSPDSEFPRFVLLNPGAVLVFWAMDDYEKVLWYEVRYKAGGEARCQHIIAPGVADNKGWQVREYALRGGAYSQQVGDTVDYAVRPILDWQHLPRPGSYYGRNELSGLEIQDSVNKVASDIKAILRLHAYPKTIAFGTSAEQIQATGIDNFTVIPNTEARVENLEMQSDLSSSMRFLETLVNVYDQQARVTRLAGNPDQYKNITNLGIKAAFMQQIEKTNTIREQYGWGIGQLSQLGMRLLGREINEPAVVWASNLPESQLEKAQTEQIKLNMGVQSKEGAAKELGQDWLQVQAQLEDEAPVGAGLFG